MELQGLGNRWVNLLIWMGCGFVSILVHELGHAMAFRLYGSWSTIILHGFGGVAVSTDPPRSAGRRMVVALAGPVAGFALCGVVYGITLALAGVAVNPYLAVALTFLLWMTLFWNAFNLLPIPPLDGGSVCRELLAMLRVPNPDVPAYGIGFVCALLLAVWGGVCVANLLPLDVRRAIPNWAEPGIYMTIWFALFAVNNFQLLQQARRSRYYYEPPDGDYDDTPPWRRR
jgi:Zn-dependent protease